MIHEPTFDICQANVCYKYTVFYSVLNYACLYLVCNRRFSWTLQNLFSILMTPIIKFVCLMIVYHKLYNDNVLNYVCPCYV